MAAIDLGTLVKRYREDKNLKQEDLALSCKTNRSVIAHLEQGRRVPKEGILETIRLQLAIPEEEWRPFSDPDFKRRVQFEDILTELVGTETDLEDLDKTGVKSTEHHVRLLLTSALPSNQTFDLFNTILVYYGMPPVSRPFFDRYLGPEAFGSLQKFELAVISYQKDAIRLYSTLAEAYREMNSTVDLEMLLTSLAKRSLNDYTARSDWNLIQIIPNSALPDLGYISAVRVKQESVERQTLKRFLEDLARDIRQDGSGAALGKYGERKRRTIDTLLRKFESRIEHGVLSPLFSPDPDALEREAVRLSPKSDEELLRMAQTQEIALQNLSYYLTADHMDVYVATSMRTDADFVSVNDFAETLFQQEDIRPLKLRYFNPTQSWIEDRIAKGLVEALMLRRASITIYMAQKGDTFGKDSEASVALGQGKPVIVYVPKLVVQGDLPTDTEILMRSDRNQLVATVRSELEGEEAEVDETIDNQALVSRILVSRLQKTPDQYLVDAVGRHWADFDLYGESERIKDENKTTEESKRSQYRTWLDKVTKGTLAVPTIPDEVRADLIRILVAIAIRFEDRAKLFREIHPLALQVILSSGVLNGILVVRSVEQCSQVLRALIENKLDLDLKQDDMNYRLVERSTGSTIRVISRHKLLRNAFETYYSLRKRP